MGTQLQMTLVIRSGLLIDEGDPYSKIKIEKSISSLKAMNIFNKVNYEILDGSEQGLKNINISIEEKPTGEISAGAGYGTEGGVVAFSIKENNYIGKGLKVSANAEVSNQSVRGGLNIVNPNYNYSGNKVFGGFSSKKTDRPESGYENTIVNLNLGTEFEQYKNIFLAPDLNFTVDDLTVDSSASESLKKQAGNDRFDFWICNNKRREK